MKWLAVTVLTSVALGVNLAHAVSQKHGQSFSQPPTITSHTKQVSSTKQGRSTGSSITHQRLILDAPIHVKESNGGSLQTIQSLANGDSVINPWMPGRGAIGVKVKVAW
jgi:hypothetical protein